MDCPPSPDAADALEAASEREHAARGERIARAVALPVALLFAWLAVNVSSGAVRMLGTMLMLTVYAREDHPVRRNQLRWGLLAIGALAFMDAYAVWSGPLDRLPFGENENGLSDPSVLTEVYGWGLLMMVNPSNQIVSLLQSSPERAVRYYSIMPIPREASVVQEALAETDTGQ